MAIKKTLIEAIPASEDGKVVSWNLTMKYEQGTEGKADYYTNEKRIGLDAVEKIGDVTTNHFTPKAEGEWTKSELEALCPTAKWDEVFTSQYDSVITNPVKNPVPDNSYVIPS